MIIVMVLVAIKVGDGPIVVSLGMLVSATLVEASHKAIGWTLFQSTRQRFDLWKGPFGIAWKSLNPGYGAGKHGNLVLLQGGMAGGVSAATRRHNGRRRRTGAGAASVICD
jgi:hypothetical protein